MAYVNDIRSADAGLFDRIAAATKALGARYAQHRVYRQTLDELATLSNRELADLGLHRSQLRAIAHEAAYGA